jgi:predicted PurR-regulated permease PerM
MPSNSFRYNLLTIIVLFLILSTVFIIYFPLAAAIILGLTVAVVIYPIHTRLSKRMSPGGSAGLLTILVLLIIGFVLAFMSLFMLQGSTLVFDMIRSITEWIATLFPGRIISGEILAGTINSVVFVIKNSLIPLLRSLPAILFNAFILFLSVFLFLLKGPAVYQQLTTSLPERLTESLKKISEVVVNTLYAIYIVSVEVAIIAFVLSLPIYYFLGYPAYIQLAIMTALSMFIPIFGPLLVMVFLILYNVSVGDIPAIFVSIFIIYPVVLWVPGSLIRPRLMGKRTSIHKVLMMIAIIGGISILGIPGLIFGPLFIALLVSSYHVLIEQLSLIKGPEGEPQGTGE